MSDRCEGKRGHHNRTSWSAESVRETRADERIRLACRELERTLDQGDGVFERSLLSARDIGSKTEHQEFIIAAHQRPGKPQSVIDRDLNCDTCGSFDRDMCRFTRTDRSMHVTQEKERLRSLHR